MRVCKYTQKCKCTHNVKTFAHKTRMMRSTKLSASSHSKKSLLLKLKMRRKGGALGKGTFLINFIRYRFSESGGDGASPFIRTVGASSQTSQVICMEGISFRLLQRNDGRAKASESKTLQPWLTAGNPPTLNLWRNISWQTDRPPNDFMSTLPICCDFQLLSTG